MNHFQLMPDIESDQKIPKISLWFFCTTRFTLLKMCNLNLVEKCLLLLLGLQVESASDDAEDKQAGRSIMQPKVRGTASSTILSPVAWMKPTKPDSRNSHGHFRKEVSHHD